MWKVLQNIFKIEKLQPKQKEMITTELNMWKNGLIKTNKLCY